MKNTLDHINGKLDITKESIHEIEENEQKQKLENKT